MSEVRFLGNRLGHGQNFDGAVFDSSYCSPTILARDYKGAKEIIEIRKVDIVNGANTIVQSRAEQSRAEQLNGCVRLGNAYDDEKFTGGNFGGNVWDSNGIAPTMKTGASASQQCVVEVKKMNYCECIGGFGEKKSNGGTQWYQQDRVYSMGDVSLCLPSQLPGGSYNYLEINKMGNGYYDAYNHRWCEKEYSGTLTTHPQDGHSGTFYVPEVKKMKIKIRQATKQGFIECEIPGLCDLKYPSSENRRGRVLRGGADKSDDNDGGYP